MKNKVDAPKKEKKKTSGPKKEVKRPAIKKPRPKKYVEAKIPTLPPVPTKVFEAKAAPLCAVHMDATKLPCLDCMKTDTVKFEIPKEILGPQTPEERFVELLHKAADELKSVADNLSIEQPRHPIPDTVYYKSGGIGAVLRLEVGGDMLNHFEKVTEELSKTHGWSKTFQVLQDELKTAKGDVVETVEDYNLEPVPVDPNDETMAKVVHIKEVAAAQKETTPIKGVDLPMWEGPAWDHVRETFAKDYTNKPPKKGWLTRFFEAILKK